MESFYGGRQGVPFVLRKSYSSTTEMLRDFNNPDFKEVWYGEYVIIDSPGDIENGKIYRRTLYREGAELPSYPTADYIGQFNGMSGSNALLRLGSLEGIEGIARVFNSSTSENWGNLVQEFPELESINMTENDFVDSNGELHQNEALSSGDSLAIRNGMAGNIFVPGYDGNEFNDDIKMNLYFDRENSTEGNALDNARSENVVNVGLEIPYPVFYPEATDIEWKQYNSSPESIVDQYGEHPFVYSLNLKLPQTVPAIELVEIFSEIPAEKANSDNKLYSISNVYKSDSLQSFTENGILKGHYINGNSADLSATIAHYYYKIKIHDFGTMTGNTFTLSSEQPKEVVLDMGEATRVIGGFTWYVDPKTYTANLSNVPWEDTWK